MDAFRHILGATETTPIVAVEVDGKILLYNIVELNVLKNIVFVWPLGIIMSLFSYF